MSLFNLFNKEEKESRPAFKVGQEWHYHTRKGEENSTLKIVKIEHNEDEDHPIIHISVLGIHLVTPQSSKGYVTEMLHLPVEVAAIAGSITTLKNDRTVLPDYEFGYVQWKMAYEDNRAGVFNLSVKDIIQFLETSAQTNK